jgi:hypothetical protein
MKKFLNALFIIAATMLALPVVGAANVAPIVALGGSLAIASILFPAKHYTGMQNGVQVELWVRYIIQKFWKDNAFLQNAFNDDQYVVGGKIVHIPQPGANPNIVKNRTVYPATAVQRTDTDLTFALDVYTTDPTQITDAEKVELSYDKMDSVLGDHMRALNQTVADDIIIKWLTTMPAASIVATSGAAAAAPVAGQTTTRKVLIHDDLRKASLVMNLQNVDKEDRYALLEANMADQLFASLSNTQYRDFSQYADAANGIIGKLYGFNIMVRSNVAMFSAADAVNPLGAAVAATDNIASVCWQKNSVTRALGEVKVFNNANRAEYYGDIISALLRSGARRRRFDDAGIVAIVGKP